MEHIPGAPSCMKVCDTLAHSEDMYTVGHITFAAMLTMVMASVTLTAPMNMVLSQLDSTIASIVL